MVASASGESGVSCMRLSVCVASTTASRSASLMAGARLGEPRLFLLRLALGLLLVRPQDQDGAVRVVDEMAADEVLEIALAAGHARLDGGERRLEGERRQRIAPMQPGAQRPQHEDDAARERAGVVLAQMKLDGVERGFERQADRCPCSASVPIVSVIRRSTLSASAASMPLSPIENIGWRSPSSRPVPARPSPRPESISAL